MTSQFLPPALNFAFPFVAAYAERRNDSWRGYYSWLPAGRSVVSYTLRLNGAGRFSLPPSRVEAMYAPAIRAQLPNAAVEIGAQ